MGVGALILAFTVILTIQAYRHTEDESLPAAADVQPQMVQA
jgi:hypothetical protein